MRTPELNILVLPYTKTNPYQNLLVSAVVKQGVNISGYIGFSPFCLFCSFLKHLFFHGKPDIIHIHWLHSYLNGDFRLASYLKSIIFIFEIKFFRVTGIKIVWTVHNLISHESNFHTTEYFFTSVISRQCDAFIAHSESIKAIIQRAYDVDDRKIHVIPHGNFIGSYENSTDSQTAKKYLGIDSNDTVFVYFGRIRPYKGLDELLDAFTEVNRSDITLLFVGNPQSSKIKKRLILEASKNYKIKLELSFVDDDKIQLYLNAADVMVLPYRDILTSGTAILGMGFKKPIIAPAIGGLIDLLDEQGSILYDPDDNNALKSALDKIMYMDLIKMGEHNYNLAKKLEWDEIGKATKNLYQSCLK